MEYVAIVTVLALLQYVWFGLQVGDARRRHQVPAPVMAGAPEFERRFRIHQNTLEQLALFLPALWMFAVRVNPLWAAGLGVVYLVGRFVYRAAYVEDPASRHNGFVITILPIAIMLVWVLVDAVIRLVQGS